MKNFNSNSVNESNNLSTISTADEMKKVSGSCTLNMSIGNITADKKQWEKVWESLVDARFALKQILEANKVYGMDMYNSKEYALISEAELIFFKEVMKM